ncbi:hypothetical protein HK102_000044 [Quaeritorhiza haematococci]|nr:hypothetical protein HK102_000044 [Quaeritorhiza haematococci]
MLPIFSFVSTNTRFIGISLYNNSKWKGADLRVEEAKPIYTERLKQEQQEQLCEPSPDASKRKRKRSNVTMLKPITEENFQDYRKYGWKRSRYGRVVCVMRLKTDRKEIKVIDPTKYKDKLMKLRGEPFDTPVRNLSWPITEPAEPAESADPMELTTETATGATSFDVVREQTEESLESTNNAKSLRRARDDIFVELTSSTTAHESEAPHLSLNESSHDSSVVQNDLGHLNRAQVLDDDDDDAASLDIESNGSSSYEDKEGKTDPTGLEINIEDEKALSMSVLNSLFKEDVERSEDQKSKPAQIWKQPQRYDPTATEATQFHQAFESESDEENVNESRHFEVNTNLRQLVFGGSNTSNTAQIENEPGIPSETDKTQNLQSGFSFSILSALGGSQDTVTSDSGEQSSESIQPKIDGKLPMFFLHIGNPSMQHRSIFTSGTVFGREGSMDDIVAKWEASKRELTDDFKKKYKAAVRRRRRLVPGGSH